MKKILQISKYYYPYIGGTEQVVRDIAMALKGTDCKQKIICFNEDATGGKYVCHRKDTVRDVVDGIEVVRCGCVAKVASQSLSLEYMRQLKNVMNEFEPDIVIIHYPNPYVTALLMPYLKRAFKLVVYWHLDITKQKLLKKLFHGQTMKLLKRADRIIATSLNYMDGSPYLRKFQDKCIAIPNCINDTRLIVTDEIRIRAKEIRNQNAGKIICFGVGRHIPYKGFSYLVKASRYLDDRFLIAIGGKGELTESLKQEARDDKKIQFLGRVDDKDLIAYYLACDIFCFPSITKNEAFGIALAEGMYFGKPAVTFTIPGSGVNYVNLNGETGIECPNCDSIAFAAALRKLAADADLRKKYGKAAQQRVLEHFMFGQFKRNVLKMLGEL